MFGAFTSFGKLGSLARAIAAAWSPAGLWYEPSDLSTMFNDSAGTTPVATPGTVADSANPVGLIQDKSGNGHHASQSTSTARPLLSARKNTLTYTEDFSNAVWVADLMGDATLTKTFSQTDPLGNATAVRLLAAMTSGVASLRYAADLAEEQAIRSAYIKSNTGVGYSMYLGDTVITLDADTEWHRYDVSESVFTWGFRVQFTASADVTLAFPMKERGTILTDYQSVPGDGSAYDGDPAKFPYYLSFDGVDDYLSTSAFTTVPQPITYFVGVNPTTKPLVGHITDGSATGREFIIFGNSTVEVNAGTTQAAGDYFAATSQINTMVFNGALSAWNRNGGSFTTINPGTQGIDRLFIGANYLGGNTLKGNLYQLIFGAAVYGAPTILEAETWVAEKTGVTL